MSEKKYYVALKCDLSHRMSREIDGIGHFFHSTNEEVKSSKFTKSELAEIMGGALYRLPVIQYNSGRICPNEEIESDTMGKFGQITRYPEWINPLIELVPVEDRK